LITLYLKGVKSSWKKRRREIGGESEEERMLDDVRKLGSLDEYL